MRAQSSATFFHIFSSVQPHNSLAMADAAEDLVDFGPDDSDEDAAYLAAGTDLDPSGAAHGEGGDGAAGERASGGGARAALAAALGGGGRGDDVGAGGADGGAGGPDEDSYGGRGGQYESVEGSGSGSGPARCACRQP